MEKCLICREEARDNAGCPYCWTPEAWEKLMKLKDKGDKWTVEACNPTKGVDLKELEKEVREEIKKQNLERNDKKDNIDGYPDEYLMWRFYRKREGTRICLTSAKVGEFGSRGF